ncbi:uncharacterized protein LOC113240302 isoform X2 [Hyposmocoma kahamanoa]|uniref:uncharacterized protein LOC113240302 isoform X2 n=1 Tax=Hyposmocoma kahamanoa TaxID=1477025 RepID=UPI000E6D7C6C|nr:uncharacterized protein LOC113240302 isoform X2 [Hyposmocoma kahamanoa]
MTGSYDDVKRISNFTCSVKFNASNDKWNLMDNIRLIVKYNNFEKEYTSPSKLENATFTDALAPISEDREVFCRSLFHNTATDQYVYSFSNAVILNKMDQKTIEMTENRTDRVTIITNHSSTFFNIGDVVYYVCESSNFTDSTKLSALQRNSKEMLERQLAASEIPSPTLAFKLNVNGTDHCTEIFCRARTDVGLNILSTRLLVQVKIDGVVKECMPTKVSPALVWYIVGGIAVFALVLVGVLYGIRDKGEKNL